MASRKQIEANKINAQSCTGPTSQAGKAVSSQNALKTGIDAESEVIRCESRSEYDQLIAEFYARYHPAFPEERGLVDSLIRSEWLSRRHMCTEKSVWERGFNATDSISLGQVFERSEKTFERLDRRINSARRNFHRDLKRLLEIRANNANEPIVPDTAIPDAEPDIPNAEPDINAAVPPPADQLAETEPSPAIATEPLNPKLVSFLIIPDPPPVTPAEPEQNGENIPPIAA